MQPVFAPGSKKIPRCDDLVKRVVTFGDTRHISVVVGNGLRKQRQEKLVDSWPHAAEVESKECSLICLYKLYPQPLKIGVGQILAPGVCHSFTLGPRKDSC